MKQIIPVVAACITKDTKVLLHRKDEPRNPELLGKWEFPGGMIEFGESPHKALQREIWEEIHMAISIGPLIYAQMNTYQDPNECYLVIFYWCCSSYLEPPDCQWFGLEEIESLDCLPGTLEVVRRLQEITSES